MTESGAEPSDSRPRAARLVGNGSGAPGALSALRDRASTVLPGLYAWLATVLLPSVNQRAPNSARVTALFALLALLAAPLFVVDRPLLSRALGIFGFIGFSLLTWLLLGAGLLKNPGDPLLSALGAVAFTLYALGWGSLRRRGVVPEDAPNVIPGLPLQPRARSHPIAPFVLGLILVSAVLPVLLAFRVVEAERGLLAHSVAILAAISTITVGSRVATGLGQRRVLPVSGERLNAAAVPLALAALLFGLGFLWLVVR
ncbi:MAG TPA: hypothetical protein VJV79_29150 [Polyangiaceae bacterium]|nr:hypothetical protein [Polyangiaceae bacterium]